MKTAVIYKTCSGFTKKYAEWIAEELAADIFDVSAIAAKNLENYDNIVYGGSLHMAGIIGLKFIKKNLNKLKDKKVVVFATGASPAKEEVLREVANKNFTQEEQKHIKFFYLRGGFDFNKLNSFDKFLMTMLKWMLKRKKELTADERNLLSAYDEPVDYTNKKDIEELINHINS